MSTKKPAKKAPKPKPTTGALLRKLADLCDEDEHLAESVAPELDTLLDDLLDQDAFGTEGQNDPRGDRRAAG